MLAWPSLYCLAGKQKRLGCGRAMKADVHSHFYTPDYVETVRRFDPEKASQAGGLDLPLWISAEERIAQMDRFGVDVEILSLSAPNVYFDDGALSDELAHLTNDFLGRLCRGP